VRGSVHLGKLRRNHVGILKARFKRTLASKRVSQSVSLNPLVCPLRRKRDDHAVDLIFMELRRSTRGPI